MSLLMHSLNSRGGRCLLRLLMSCVLIHSQYEKGWCVLFCCPAPLQSFKIFGNKMGLLRAGACFSLPQTEHFVILPLKAACYVVLGRV